MISIVDKNNGTEIRRCIGEASSGDTFSVTEVPDEVRIFSDSSPNGDATTAYSYAEGSVQLDTDLNAGETVKAYSAGTYFFEDLYFINNVEEELDKTNIMQISDDEFNLKDVLVDIDTTITSNSDTIEWNDGGSWSDTFPINVGTIDQGTTHEIEFRITIDDTDTLGNYRDIAITYSGRQEGTE